MNKTIKKVIAGASAVSLLGTAAAFAADNTKAENIIINGDMVIPGVIEQDGTVMIPLRAVSEALGYTVSWDNDSETATISGEQDYSFTIGETHVGYMSKDRAAAGGFGVQVLETAPILVEDSRTYVPVEALDIIGEQYTVNGDAIEIGKVEPESVLYSGEIKEIDGEKVLISTEERGDVALIVSEETNIHHYKNRMRYTAEDLTVGMKIEAVCGQAMTFSIPPQTVANEIIIYDGEEEEKETEPQSVTLKGKITAADEGEIMVSDEERGEVILMITEDTNIHHYKNRMRYTAEDLTVGMNIEAVCGETMTLSLPPQTNAVEIIIYD